MGVQDRSLNLYPSPKLVGHTVYLKSFIDKEIQAGYTGILV